MALLSARGTEGDAATNWGIVTKCDIPVSVPPDSLNETLLHQELAGADWAVDALFGSGLRGAVQSPYDRVIAAINAGAARVFAVDIPSGLDSDTGRPLGAAVRAQHTATVGAPKWGFAEPAAQEWLGQLHVIDIGLPRVLLPKRNS